jgi:hypothetical protein
MVDRRIGMVLGGSASKRAQAPKIIHHPAWAGRMMSGAKRLAAALTVA